MKRLVTVGLMLALLGAAGYVAAAPVTKQTIKTPASGSLSTGYSPVGASASWSGPGAIASSTGAGLKLFSFQNGAVTGTAAGNSTLLYTADAPGTYFKFYVSIVGGINFAYAKRWNSGAGSASGGITWTVTETVDGVAVVALNGSETSTATVNSATGSDLKWKPVVKFTGGLIVLSNSASVSNSVGATSNVNLTNGISTGVATGNVVGFNFGT